MRDPTFRALACAAVLIALWFAFGPIPQVQPQRVTNLRLQWKQCADVVLVGDSTLAWTVQPELIEDELGGGYRVVNFGFVAALLTDTTYLTAAEQVLDPASHPTVVIAVNFTNARTDIRGRRSGFKRERGAANQDRRGASSDLDWRDEIDLRLRPRGLCSFLWNVCPWGGQLHLGYNGQLKSTMDPHDETRLIPTVIDQNNAPGPIYDQDGIDASLFTWVAAVHARGIDVVAYVESDRPAIAPLNEAAGYDRSWFTQKLRDAGAAVIDYPSDLTTVDGIHLDPISAQRWSHELGKALAARLPHRTAGSEQRCAWPLQSADRR